MKDNSDKPQKSLKQKSKFKSRYPDQDLNRKQNLAQQKINRNQKLQELNLEYIDVINQKCIDLNINIEGLKSWGLYVDKQTYINREISKWDDQQLIFPTGKFRDAERIYATHQQKFAEALIEICPDVIESLREFVPYFVHLFNKKDSDYYDIFERKIKHDWSFVSGRRLHSLRFAYEPNNRAFNYKFYWGEYEDLLRAISMAVSIEWLPEDLTALDLTDDLIRYIELTRKIVSIEKYTIDNCKQVIEKAFTESALDINNSLKNFLKLQIGLIEWARKYHLEKDWLINYAHYFIWQFGKTPEIEVSNLQINPLNIRSLEANTFEFRVRGWRAGDETKEEYQEEVLDFFLSKLDKYFDESYRDLELEKITKITNPIKYDGVKWLVWETVLGWDRKQILDEIYREHHEQAKELENEVKTDPSTITKAFKKFKRYDLPFRNNQ